MGNSQVSELHCINGPVQQLFEMSLFNALKKSLTLFSTSSKSLNNYPNYKRPKNYLNVSEFIEKFKTLQTDRKEEQVSLTGTAQL